MDMRLASHQPPPGVLMLYLNYEPAQHLLGGDNHLLNTVGCRLNGYIISNEGRSRDLRPRWPFEMPYFYISTSIVVARYLGHVLQLPNVELPRFRLPNVPDLTKDPWPSYHFVELGLAEEYENYVSRDAAPQGNPFDLEYALHIICHALTPQVLKAIPTEIQYRNEHPNWDSFDEWLKGFTNTPESESE